ncbi:MAG: putative response regulator (CheY-like) [Candidatus Jettenia ecosi]|uniref:Putative response regulator (CheY-like) n=1 Tax=Candidatus Jettenia ecosi TaxID=2494326 RepID=A0A533Q7Y9_9BACT|nr:MAG: putative response regulator (CheY-like) [Candidatus Jettenia ecosi]
MNKQSLSSREVKKKVMVADDNPDILDSTKIILEEAGYEVETAVDGQAVRRHHEEYPDLILLDIWLAGMDGADICKYLKGQETTKQTASVSKKNHRKEREKIKEEYEARLRIIFESIKGYAIFTFDTTGVITSWNAGVKALFGYA